MYDIHCQQVSQRDKKFPIAVKFMSFVCFVCNNLTIYNNTDDINWFTHNNPPHVDW